jgi:hypothetical protein
MAVAGVVAAHALTYVVAVRQPVHRESILIESGHSYWTSAVAIAIVLGVFGVAALGIRVVRGLHEQPDPHRWTRVAPILAVVQVLAYFGIEVVERVLSRASVAELFDHHEILFTGAALQVATALLGALVLHLLSRTIRLVAEALRSRQPQDSPAVSSIAPRTAVLVRSSALRCAWGLRGPPSPFVARIAGR